MKIRLVFPNQIDFSLNQKKIFTLIAAIVVLMVILLAVTQILGRKLLNTLIPGFIDQVEKFMYVFAFLGISYCQRFGGHIRMDIVVSYLQAYGL